MSLCFGDPCCARPMTCRAVLPPPALPACLGLRACRLLPHHGVLAIPPPDRRRDAWPRHHPPLPGINWAGETADEYLFPSCMLWPASLPPRPLGGHSACLECVHGSCVELMLRRSLLCPSDDTRRCPAAACSACLRLRACRLPSLTAPLPPCLPLPLQTDAASSASSASSAFEGGLAESLAFYCYMGGWSPSPSPSAASRQRRRRR